MVLYCTVLAVESHYDSGSISRDIAVGPAGKEAVGRRRCVGYSLHDVGIECRREPGAPEKIPSGQYASVERNFYAPVAYAPPLFKVLEFSIILPISVGAEFASVTVNREAVFAVLVVIFHGCA